LAVAECTEAYAVLECAWHAVEAALAAVSGQGSLVQAVTAAFMAAEQAPTSEKGTARMVQDLRVCSKRGEMRII